MAKGKISKIEEKRIEDCEWVFQFDEDEPQVFAWTDTDISTDEDPSVTFTISNVENAFISFKHNESKKTFKLFARPITKAGKKMRDEANKLKELQSKELENLEEKFEDYASENQEA
jgi:hypothetical protein